MGVRKPSVGRSKKTGVRKFCDSVQFMAMLTDLIMAFVPVPVVVDPFLKTRVHLVRWLEWTIAGYTMIFLIEIIDNKQREKAHFLAITQAGSTACALFFPFMPNLYCYVGLFIASFALYGVLFPRLRQKLRAATAAAVTMAALRKSAQTSIIGLIASINTEYEAKRTIVAAALLTICTAVWTVFILVFFMEPAAHLFYGERKEDPVWPFVMNSVLHVVVKLFFSGFIAASEESLFTTESRTKKIEEEVGKFLGQGLQGGVSMCAGFLYEHADQVSSVFSPATTRVFPTGGKDVGSGCAEDGELRLHMSATQSDHVRKMIKLLKDCGGTRSSPVDKLRCLADMMSEDDNDDDDGDVTVLDAAFLCCEYQRTDSALRPRCVTPSNVFHVIKVEHVTSIVRKCIASHSLAPGCKSQP